ASTASSWGGDRSDERRPSPVFRTRSPPRSTPRRSRVGRYRMLSADETVRRAELTPERVRANLERLRRGIEEACERRGRDPTSVRIVGASKTVSADVLRWAWEAGVREFGENYVQELGVKRPAVPDATWHFIGTLQSHTAHRVGELADIVQTLAPGRAFTRLARRAVDRGRRLRVLIEVDFAGRGTGVTPEECEAFADEVAATEG